jgi:hypothetical protein
MQTQQRTLLLTHSLTHLIPAAIAAAAVQHPAVEAHRVPLLEPGSHWRTGGYQRFLGPDAGVEYVVRGRYVRLGQKRGVAHVPLDVLAEGECRERVCVERVCRESVEGVCVECVERESVCRQRV